MTPCRPIPRFLRHPATAWMILVVSFLLTWLAWFLSDNFVQQRARDRFQFETEDVKAAIARRMLEYEAVLRGGIALFAASREVTREIWRTYAANLSIDTYYPGIQGIGFSRAIPPEEREAVTRAIRAEGYPQFHLWPEGQRDFLTAIVFLEPFVARNLRAFGYDMFSEPVRRTAMERARDTGEAAMSGIVTLVQETREDVQKGFLLYLPVYRHGAATETVAERRAALTGFVYSPFRIKDLMRGILGQGMAEIDFELFDGDRPSAETMLYDSDGEEVPHGVRPGPEPGFERSVPITLGGRLWTLHLYTRPGYVSPAEESQPLIVAVSGVLVDLLLFVIIGSISRQERRARVLAEGMTVELRTARERAESASRAKSAFLAAMSHDIRTPLHAILGMNEVLLERGLDPETQRYAQIARRAGKGLLELIDGILDLSRIEAGQMVLENVPFSPRHVAEGVLSILAPLAEEKGIALTGWFAPDLSARVAGDPARLRQVLMNLVGNAVKFTGRGKVSLKVAPGSEPDEILFTVEDSGCGIPEEELAAIFDPFTRGVGSRRRGAGGSGLGLAICRQLVERMGGGIGVASASGKGSVFRFTVRLPAAPQQEPVAASVPSQPDAVPEERKRPRTILLVDDSEDNRVLIDAFLKNSPHRLEMAESGEEALARFRPGCFDLVLMDVQMPGMDGREATRAIRTLEREGGHAATPILALTAFAMKEDEECSLAAGCDGHLTKPIKKAVLLEAIQRFSRRSGEAGGPPP